MSSKQCMVCSATIPFTRMGVASCRACASFFKRSKMTRKQFVCRQGNGKCVFRKHEKFMCRSCRFDRCVELGMEFSGSAEDLEAAELAELRPRSTSSSSSSASSSSSQRRSLLASLSSAYQKSCQHRLAHERRVAKSNGLERLKTATEEVFLSTTTTFREIFPDTINEVVGMITEVFPFVQQLEVQEKEALFLTFVSKFSMLEGFYRTCWIIESRHFLVTMLTAINCDDLNHWIRSEDKIEDEQHFRAVLNHYSTRYETVMGRLHHLDISETEFVALVIIVFCDTDLSLDVPEHVTTTLDAIRSSVFEELQDYYKHERKLVDFSTRMGRIMTIGHTTSEAGILMDEETRTYSALFDYVSVENILREIFARP